jgi:hypothetical protein
MFLSGGDMRFSICAAELLGDFGAEASCAIPAIEKALHDPAKWWLRDAACKAIEQIREGASHKHLTP